MIALRELLFPLHPVLWWARQVVLMLCGCYFILLGVNMLISAYGLNHPGWFILTFFASNLIILISATLLLGLVIRAGARLKRGDVDKEQDGAPCPQRENNNPSVGDC